MPGRHVVICTALLVVLTPCPPGPPRRRDVESRGPCRRSGPRPLRPRAAPRPSPSRCGCAPASRWPARAARGARRPRTAAASNTRSPRHQRDELLVAARRASLMVRISTFQRACPRSGRTSRTDRPRTARLPRPLAAADLEHGVRFVVRIASARAAARVARRAPHLGARARELLARQLAELGIADELDTIVRESSCPRRGSARTPRPPARARRARG